MRILLALLIIVPLCLSEAFAQTPPLMNYQGAARAHDGTLLAERDIALRISILQDGPNGPEVYSETHNVRTSDLGLFTLNIGGGDLRQGALDAVRWGDHTHWLQVEIDENGGRNYSILGASQLLAVPYAFHATHSETADKLKGAGDGRGGSEVNPGSPGTPWVLEGNEQSDPAMHFVGTTDTKDLVFRTDNIERVRLTAYGKLGIGEANPASTVDVSGNLTVGSGYAGMYEAPENGALFEGSVGIGEMFPTAPLEVAGEVVVGSNFTGLYLPPLDGMLVEGRLGVGTSGPGSKLSVKGGLSVGNTFSENAAPTNGAIFEGAVGIGTADPESDFGVSGNAAIGFEYARAHTAPENGLIVQGPVGIGTPGPLGTLDVAGNLALGSSYAGTLLAPPDGAIIEGSVGIGTPDSKNKLDVAGNTAIGEGYAGTHTAPTNGMIIQGPLAVGKPTTDKKLEVLGDSKLDGNLHVTGNSELNGTLDVDGVTTLHNVKDVPINTLAWDSTAAPNPAFFDGGLNVKGGVGAEQNMNVGRDIGVARDAWIGRNLTVRGDGRFNNLYVDNLTTSGDTVTSNMPMTFINKGETDLYGQTSVLDTTNSTAKTNGALTVAGGLGVEKNLNLGGQLHMSFPTSKTVSKNSPSEFPVYIEGIQQGIALKLRETASSNNFYVGFWDNSKIRGRIEGQTWEELHTNWNYILTTALDWLSVVYATYDLSGAAGDVRFCGITLCGPGPVPIVFAALKLASAIATAVANQIKRELYWGVSYQSESADYAEWLEKEDPDEDFTFGDIVGVRAGKISRRTEGAEMLFVISQAPVVLGNTPEEGQEYRYEKCAFLGQVPVKVRGAVRPGDYVVASPAQDGSGYAVAPADMTAEIAARTVGVAWGMHPIDAPGYVNVAVGMPARAQMQVQQQQAAELDAVQQELADLKAVIAQVIPDLDMRLADIREARGEGIDPANLEPRIMYPVSAPVPDLTQIDVDLMTPELMQETMTRAKELFAETGQDPTGNPFFQRYDQDGAFRADFLAAIKSSFQKGGDTSDLQRLMTDSFNLGIPRDPTE